jgi:hypothetical protein
MRTTVITLSVLLVLALLFQAFRYITNQQVEEQKFTVIKKYPEFEIRFYPSAVLATVYSKAKTYKELAGPGFNKLAGYIFGGNEKDTKIAMTAPVRMDINDSNSSMSFVMPSNYSVENLPKPNNASIQVKKVPEEYVAVIKFAGYASDKDIKSYSEKLQKLLLENGILSHGNYRFLAYNPPFQIIGRRNEIIVSVHWKQ